MSFSQKIYFNDKQLILSTNNTEYINNHPEAAGYIAYHGASKENFAEAVQQLEQAAVNGTIIVDSKTNLLTQLNSIYHTIDAGGGLVYNEQGDLLMIFRRGKWDLPKGKLDEGEDIATCALREVKEETGLKNVKPGEKLGETYHIYTLKGEQILKRSTWYKMYGTSADKLTPQQEEDIHEAKWVSKKELPGIAKLAYALVREILQHTDS